MRRTIIAAASFALAALLGTIPVFAADWSDPRLEAKVEQSRSGPYFRMDAGGEIITIDDIDGDVENPYLGAGLGYRLDEVLRFDVTLDGTIDEQDADIDTYTVLANVYMDMPFLSQTIVPYVGGGVGASGIVGVDGLNLALAGAAGVSVPIGDTLNFDIGYRLLYVETNDLGPVDYTLNHTIRAGLRFEF